MPVSQEELGRRLKAAREANKMTQDDVAARLGVSRSTIAQTELGNRGVGGAELERLAYLYGRDPRDLMAETFEAGDGFGALFRAEPDGGDREALIAAARESRAFAQAVTDLERVLDIHRVAMSAPAYVLPDPRGKWEAVQQGLRVAEDERKRLGLGVAPLPDLEELLEAQGVRAAGQQMPDNVSGMTLPGPRAGMLVVVNARHGGMRIRFSFAHEYAHVLLDRDRLTVSRADERDAHIEVRANSFAAGFLMPEDGIRAYFDALGKGRDSRMRAAVVDGKGEALPVEGRATPNTQDVQVYELVLVAHRFGVSPIAALYRLKNVGLVSERQLQTLKPVATDAEHLRKVAEHLSLPNPDGEVSPAKFERRFLVMALEAYRRAEISRAKLRELAQLAGKPGDWLDDAVADLGIDE